MSENEREQIQEGAFRSLSELKRRWKEGTFGEILEDWRWIFSYSKRYKGAILFYTLLGVLSTVFTLAGSVAGKYLIDIVTGRQTGKLGLLLGVMIGGSLFSLAFRSVINRISARLGVFIHNDIQADIFDQIIGADWLSVSGYAGGDILNRFNSDVGAVSGNAISWLPTIVIAVFNFAATFVVIWHYSRVMALLAFLSAPFMLLMSRVLIRKQREYQRQVRELNSHMMTFEAETFYNFDTIKSFGISGLYGRRMREWQAQYKDISLLYNLFTIKTNVFMSLMALLVQMVSFLYCLYLLWNGQITYGTMTLFLTQRSRLSTAFNEVVGIIPSFLTSSVSAHRIRELTDLPREKRISLSDALLGKAKHGVRVRLTGADFAYIPSRPVLSGSNLEASPGEITALIGPSGEGKTTLIRLILGLIYPQSGSVTLETAEGEPIEANAETRGLIAYVPQGNTMLSGTIAENMRLAKEDATDEEIIAALKLGCAWEFVEKLPDGIHARIRERGRGLSEGQSQRIAIARALLRDAPILLLDEATSALDTATERRVLKNIVEACPNRTCIVTTHRPSVLNLCTRVYRVMNTEVTQLDEAESSRMAMDF